MVDGTHQPGRRRLVSVLLLNWNQREYLGACLHSVKQQRYPSIELLVVDNASSDGSCEMVRARYPETHLIRLDHNLGYGAGHNRGLREAKGEYLLLLNADLVLEPTFVEEMVRVMEQADDIGMVQGKLYQMTSRDSHPRRFDSVGLLVTRDRRTLLRGYGELDHGQYDIPEEIFAPDGAAPLYRRKMLDDIQLEGAYFDEAFFMYREEVDLGWRARWRGWRAFFAPRAVAFHVRRYAPGQRRRQPWWLRRLQFRNRYCLLIKHETPTTFARDALPILWFELKALGYCVLREPHYFLAYLEALRLAPKMWKQRTYILSQRRVGCEEMVQWFV